MLTVDDADGGVWLEIVELLSEQDDYDMVLFPHPGSDDEPLPAPFVGAAIPPPLESAATYPEGTGPACSARLRVTADSIEELGLHLDEFEDWGDTLALYPIREWAWAARFVTGERTVFIRDAHLYGYLDAAGIQVRRDEDGDIT